MPEHSGKMFQFIARAIIGEVGSFFVVLQRHCNLHYTQNSAHLNDHVIRFMTVLVSGPCLYDSKLGCSYGSKVAYLLEPSTVTVSVNTEPKVTTSSHRPIVCILVTRDCIQCGS